MTTRTVTDTARGSKQEPKPGIRGAIGRLFRQAAKLVTKSGPAPAPKKSGRRSGEDRGRQFRRVARKILTSRAAAYIGARLWLADTLDWLDLWQPTIGPGDELTGDLTESNNHLSPRL